MTYYATGYKAYCAPAKVSYYCVPAKPVVIAPVYCPPVKIAFAPVKVFAPSIGKYCPPAKPFVPQKPIQPQKPVEPQKPVQPQKPNKGNDVCKDCVDDGNQTNRFGGKDKNPGNIIKGVAPEDGAAHISGTDKKDTIYGTAGEDVIKGLKGADVIYGGDGNDTIHGDDNGDSLYGQGGSDYLQGGTGNDYLNGGEGADTMLGGDGNDIYFVDHKGDVVKEFGNATAGYDAVRSTIDYTLPDNIEELYLQGTDNLSGTGNGLNNNIYGNSGDNKLFGLGGDDCLVGRNGNDYLDGGIGNDILKGGKGDDTYFFAKGYGFDTIEDDGGRDTLVFGEGIRAEDLIFSGSKDDLFITFKNSSDKIRIEDWFDRDDKVEVFKFADGSSYDMKSHGNTMAFVDDQFKVQLHAPIF